MHHSSCPDYNALILMDNIDRLPRKWRYLVYEYGYAIVIALRESGLSLQEADDVCWLHRSGKQAEHLATDYITRKTAKNYFV